ncbi:MAG TPA: hypothetical protein VF121_06980 [Thermoanaerobaculia bacterium]|nr:hypothetical protein [Thermoanaerobaculia bacterium]
MGLKRLSALPLAAILACASPAPPAAPEPRTMDSIAEQYVKLVLAAGRHDADLVDAYYGPAEWKAAAEAATVPLPELKTRVAALIAATEARRPHPAAAIEEIHFLRHAYLLRQLQALAARLDMLSGARLSFDEESRALYDAVAPHRPAEHFEAVLAELAPRVPGDGPLPQRVEAFRQRFAIPREKLDAVFRAAIDECRPRTLAHVELPSGESFRVEYVTGRAWSGYNWYQGGFHSLIQVNTELPIFIDRAIDLACHEGYPGHHVYNALLEARLVRERGWVEHSVYNLFSPQSLIAEGTANFGIEVVFPGAERIAFERERLFPLAGLDPAQAAEYYGVQQLLQRLSYAGNQAARRYLDGAFTAEQAADWLVRYTLVSPERAKQRVAFFDKYRSYVINYNLGQDLVREHVEAQGGTADRPDVRWRVFTELLSSPRLPSDLER